jgi:hypothetical protein
MDDMLSRGEGEIVSVASVFLNDNVMYIASFCGPHTNLESWFKAAIWRCVLAATGAYRVEYERVKILMCIIHSGLFHIHAQTAISV